MSALALCSISTFLAVLAFGGAPSTGFAPKPTGSANQTTSTSNSGWSIVASPNAVSSGQTNAPDQLSSLTCNSTTDCWAVGVYDTINGIGQTLIEQWNGSSWAVVSSPNNSATESNGLNGVTCTSESECWAVGYAYQSTNVDPPLFQGLIEQWNGTSWTVTSVNGLPTPRTVFTGVTCPSASECWAVGYSLDTTASPSVNRTLIAQWNGSSWTIVASPNTSAMESNLLNGVTCTSATNCWAVGYYYGPSNPLPYQSLIEHWNGVSWAIVPSPTISGNYSNYLSSVTCASTTNCWAIGGHDNGLETDLTLIEHWNGSSWAVVASPNAITNQNNVLNGVSCASASECWAVGYYVPDANLSQTLIEQWDGTAWSIVASPNVTNAEYNQLNGVICNPPNNCWAVGYWQDP